MAKSKTTFMQENILQALALCQNTDKEKRFDAAMAICEKAWDKLCENDYGTKPAKDPTERKNVDWYNELTESEVIAFDKAWGLYKREGSRDAAAKAWKSIDRKDYDHIHKAIPKYIEGLFTSGTSKAHFSTWLNQKRWESFDVSQVKKVEEKVKHNEKAGEIRHLETQIEIVKDETLKAKLQEQLDKLRGGSDA